MRFRNTSKEVLRFECGDEVKQVGTVEVMDAGIPRRMARRVTVPRTYVVQPGEVVELDEGYALPRYGSGHVGRGSYLDEAKLTGKLVPVEPRAS